MLRGQEWHGVPVIVYKRTTAEIVALKRRVQEQPMEPDRQYYQWLARSHGNWWASAVRHGERAVRPSKLRSLRDDVLVVLGISADLGCGLQLEQGAAPFSDPCSGAQYDSVGRILAPNARERHNLLIPPHFYQGDVLVLGRQADAQVVEEDFAPDIQALSISDGAKVIEAVQWRQQDLALRYAAKKGSNEYETVAGASALHVAAAKGSSSLVSALIKLGFDSNKIARNGATPLHFALLAGNEENAAVLVALGARMDAFCSGGRCAESAESFLKKNRRVNDSTDVIERVIARLQESARSQGKDKQIAK